MKTRFVSRALATLAAVVTATVSFQSQASETPPAATANDPALPPEIQPGTPAAEVLKLVQAGVDESVIQAYVSNCPSAFNLDADKIIVLSDAGLPGDMVNAMIAHDKNYLSSLAMSDQSQTDESTQSPTTEEVATNPEPASLPPAPAEMTVNYFYNNLTPYGSWVEVAGYGRCWRPNIIIYDATWRPYCDRGHWVYTDCGWYWDSDYAWGITFHYGRWFKSPQYGWCWWPDTVWAPSWVTWRSYDSYCGWAPLPPLTVYRPGIGFYYRGNSVSIGFSFGLTADCYTFVSTSHFCNVRPRYYCVPSYQVNQFYGRTTVVNNFNCNNNTIVNNGVSVTVIGRTAPHPIQTVPVAKLVNNGHYGWHGVPAEHRTYGTDTKNHSGHINFSSDSSHPQNSHPANFSRPENHGNQITKTETYSFNKVTPSRPGPTPGAASPARESAPKMSPTQNQSKNYQSHQTARPASPPVTIGGSTTGPASPGNWHNNNANRNESHPAIREPSHPSAGQSANHPPVVIGHASPNNNNAHPGACQSAPHFNAPSAAPSMSSPSQGRPQIGNDGSHGWASRNH